MLKKLLHYLQKTVLQMRFCGKKQSPCFLFLPLTSWTVYDSLRFTIGQFHFPCILPSLTLQDSDNPDLRDRGYIYWRLLSTDPVAAKEVVLAEKPLISEETDLIEPTLLEELICHIGTLASVYHKPPSAFVEGSRGVQHKRLATRAGSWVSVYYLYSFLVLLYI